MEIFKPPHTMSFEGNIKEEWMRFKKLFEVYMKATKKNLESEDIKVAMLLNLMGEKAIEIFETFQLSSEEQRNSVKVIQAFDAYCNPKDYITYERFKFYNRNQQVAETFDHFYTDLMKMAKKCNFETTTEPIADQMVRDRIIMGINSRDVQEKLLRMESLTLKKVVELCRIAEVTQNQVQEMHTQAVHALQQGRQCHSANNGRKQQKRTEDFKFNQRNDLNAATSGREDKMILKCNNCSYDHRINKCPAYGKICVRCNKKNHFAKVCKNKKVDEMCQEIESNYSDSSVDVDAMVISSVEVGEIEGKQKKTFWFKTLSINGVPMKFKIDSGAEVNIIPLSLYKKHFKTESLTDAKVKLEAYGGFTLRPAGMSKLKISSGRKDFVADFVIADVKSSPILGLRTCVDLKLIKRIDEIRETIESSESFIEKHKDVFTGLGCFPEKSHIYIDPNANPVQKPLRRIPMTLREKVNVKLNEMERIKIIEKIKNPSEWVHQLVIVEKPDKSVRLCLDPKELNANIVKESFEIPTLNDLSSKLNGMKYFTVLDLKDGFWQVKLDSKSSKLCTFITPFGCYKFNRLPFGLNCAPENFQKLNSKYFGDIKGVFIYIDDILVFGKALKEHDDALKEVIERAQKINVKFNPNKMQYRVNKVKYLGYIFYAEGVRVDPDRVEAIRVMTEPRDKKELQRFLGMINTVRNFIPNLAELTAPLRDLLKNRNSFCWLPNHSKVFSKLKEKVSKAPVLRTFSESLPIVIQTDASKSGLGACLQQNKHPVCYASKVRSDTEQNYAQIEKKLLAILFACQKLHYYIYGRQVIIITDRKPLVALSNKSIGDIHSTRLQKMRLKLLRYDLQIQYLPGKELHLADTLSRAYNQDDNSDVDRSLNEIVHSVNVSDSKIDEIRHETKLDEELQPIILNLKSGWPDHISRVNEKIRKYWQLRHYIYEEDGIIFYKERIIIPKSLRIKLLNTLHEPHLGTSKTKKLADITVFWPNINADIENYCLSC